MKRYYCRHMFNEINFDVEKIQICSGISAGASHELYDSTKWKTYDDFLKDLFNWRQNVLKQAHKGIIPNECRSCIELQEENIGFVDYIKGKFVNNFPVNRIYVKSFRQCELACVYCLERRLTNGKQTFEVVKSDYYDFIPIFKKMIELNLIDKDNTTMEFHGGSISVWDEFDEVIDMAHQYGIRKYAFSVNAYRFLPKIAEVAKDSEVNITLSIDSGCRETFEKIKNADKFDDVVKNIVDYAKAGANILFKYIILKDINDNIEELQKFCNLVSDIIKNETYTGGFATMIDIDYRDINNPDYVMPKEHKELIRYITEWGKEAEVDVVMQGHVRKMYEEI